jgi:hypothetical protein
MTELGPRSESTGMDNSTRHAKRRSTSVEVLLCSSTRMTQVEALTICCGAGGRLEAAFYTRLAMSLRYEAQDTGGWPQYIRLRT